MIGPISLLIDLKTLIEFVQLQKSSEFQWGNELDRLDLIVNRLIAFDFIYSS